MKLVAAAVNQTVDSFVHAGYLSAYPRSYGQHDVDLEQAKTVLDVPEALRLKGEVSGLFTSPDSMAASLAASDSLRALLIAALVFAALGLAYLLLQKRPSRRLATGLGAAVALLSLPLLAASPPPTAPAVAAPPGPQEYVHPDLATQVLLHGLIGEAIINKPVAIQTLRALEREIALPVAKPTPGEAWALAHFDVDGWGKAFRLESTREARWKGSDDLRDAYRVTSAGPDGAFGTKDDVSATFSLPDDMSWDHVRRSLFLVKDGKDPRALIHRSTSKYFRFNDEETAQRISGGKLFDAYGPARDTEESWGALPVNPAWERAVKKFGRESLFLLVL